MIVVLSLSMTIFFARPSSASVTFSSFLPRLSNSGCAAGQDADVFEHGLAAVAVAGGLHGADLQRAAEPVDHQRGQGLAVDVLGDQSTAACPS